jgi:hypothetical protein
MRTTLSLLSPLAAAVLSAAAVTPAAAQHAAAPEHARPVVRHAADSVDASLRPVASYRFAASRPLGLPAQVTVADSAGGLVASYRMPGDRGPRPMLVNVLDTDLVLQGDTPSGVLTLQLYRQNDPGAAGAVFGKWWLGSRQGELRGRDDR